MAFEEDSPTLLDLLSISILLDSILPYLPLSSIAALLQTCHALHDLLLQNSRVFRSVDLSRCRGAYVSPNLLTRIDRGGHSWRAQRMDENLTEDEFYAGPLRGVLSRLSRINVLGNIQTLVLDELASVTQDLISDLVLDPAYNVRFLSVRRCLNVNHAKLQQLLRHLCRPSRPTGTPNLQGLYVFTPPVPLSQHALKDQLAATGVTSTGGAQLGAQPRGAESACSSGDDPWYTASGQVISQGHGHRTAWEETLLACHGIIAFDAVLCTHMHADMEPALHPASRDFLTRDKPGIPPMATIALGPHGCAGCGRNPRGAPIWGDSDPFMFPLLWPPPASGKLVDAVRPPPRIADQACCLPQRLIVSCTWCLTNRHCDSCHRWWCPDCYDPATAKMLGDVDPSAGLSRSTANDWTEPQSASGGRTQDDVKVFSGLCVQTCLIGEWMAGAGSGGMWG